jgi:hypothetical protein
MPVKALFRKFSDRGHRHFDQAKVSSLITRARGTVRQGRKILAEVKGIQMRSEQQGFRMTSLALGVLIDGRFGRTSRPKAEETARRFVIQRVIVTQAQMQVRRQASQAMQGISLLDSALKFWPSDGVVRRLDPRMSENLALLTQRADEVLALLAAATRGLEGLLDGSTVVLPEEDGQKIGAQVEADLASLKEQVGWETPTVTVDP